MPTARRGVGSLLLAVVGRLSSRALAGGRRKAGVPVRRSLVPRRPAPLASRLSRDGRYDYSVAMMSDELYEIDTMTFERRAAIDVGKQASGIDFWKTVP